MDRAILVSAAAAMTLLAAAPATSRPEAKDQVQAEIWAKERAIYGARGRGDMQVYIDAMARDYLAWPPFRPAPAGLEGLQELKKKMVADNKELLSMIPVAFSLNGDAAIIYYQTHRTRLPDGTAADEHFEVVHSWVREGGRWKLLGGMARNTPVRP